MEQIRTAFSLRSKILAWFFLNLAVLGGVLFLFLRVQFNIGINSLLAGPTSDRLESIAQPLAADLYEHPATEWPTALERAVAAWRGRGVQASLFRNDGTYVAGDIHTLPAEVLKLIEQHERLNHGPPRTRGRGPGNGQQTMDGRARRPGPPANDGDDFDIPGLTPDDIGFGPAGPPRDQRDEDRDEGRPPNGLGDGLGPGGPPRLPLSTESHEKFMLATPSPHTYWAGVNLGEMQRPTHGGPSPSVTLVLASGSLRGGGLFFDYLPWLTLGSGLVLVSALMWLPFAFGLTRSLARMTRVAEEIAQGRFETPHISRRRDELGRLGRAIGHMAHRLEGFVTGQKRFLGDTAHELLSPLARLEVALSILEQNSCLEGSDRRHAERALDEVHHISDLVQDLLSYTKAGMRAQSAEVEPVALAEVARKAVAREAAGDKVTVAVADDVRVCADFDLLTRALANAVRNAVRYAGDAGPITIFAEPSRDESGQETVTLTIQDGGPGVPPEALDRLFDPFFRPEAARTRETGGTGLGLAIVKSCVEACGGRVAVRNRTPSGLELTFTLPRAN